MSNGNYRIFTILFVVLLAILLVLYYTYTYKTNIEFFENHMSSFVPKTSIKQGTKETPLIPIGFLKSDDIQSFSSRMYVSNQTFASISTNDIYQKIIDDLNKTKININEEFITGPIFIIVCKEKYDATQVTHVTTHLHIMYPSYKFKDDDSIKLIKNGNVVARSYFEDKISDIHSSCVLYEVNKFHKLFNNI